MIFFSTTPLWNLTDVTLADEDTNSILTDNANRAIQGNVAIQVTYYVTRLNLVLAKFATNASGAIWWQNMQLMQVAPPGAQNWNQCKLYYRLAKFGTNASDATCVTTIQLAKFETNASGILFSWRDNSSYRLYTIMGPLCLWQCFNWMPGQ